VPTEWAEIADAEHVNISIAQVSPGEVAAAAIAGMVAGKRSVVPGLVPKVASIGGRYVPRSVLLPALRIVRDLRR
jgi:short-subunit dehydrogenase